MFLQVDRFRRTHSCSQSRFKYEFVVGECKEIIERAAAIIQKDLFTVIRLPDLESIGQAVSNDMAAAFVFVPDDIGYCLQPIAIPRHFSFVLRIDPFEVPETLREVFYPVIDLLFGEDPDTIRFGLLVESLAVGVVVRISEERPIESEVVIGFWIEVLADEKQDTVSSETSASFLEIVFQAVRGVCNTVE